MQYFLFVLLFFPFLLHSYVLVKRKSQPDSALLDSHQPFQVKSERSLENPTVVVNVDRGTIFSSSPTSFSTLTVIFNLDNPVQQLDAISAISLQSDFTETNVLFEPRKRDAAAVGAGCAIYCEDDG